MEAEDLMINDIVNAIHDDGETKKCFPIVITGVSKFGNLGINGEDAFEFTPLRKDDEGEMYADDFKQTELTKEILYKNDFVAFNFGTKFVYRVSKKVEDWIELELNGEKDKEYFTLKFYPLIKLEYVDQLQRLLRSFGLKELADNLKI